MEQAPDSADPNPFRYCGEYFDRETGTYYLRARYYSPGTGRFTQEDPSCDGLNWYVYCNGSPEKYVDPSGCAGELTLAWSGGMWWLCGVDLALPIGDVIYIAGVGAMSIADAVNEYGMDAIAHLLANASNAIAEGVEYVAEGVEYVGEKVQEGWAWLKDKVSNLVDKVSETFGGGSSQPPRDPNEWDKIKETASNFRENLRKMTQKTKDEIAGKEAHHTLPQKFRDLFDQFKIKIDDPQYGAWVDKAAHSKWNYAYNQAWQNFFDSTDNITAELILDFARQLAQQYGYEIYF